MKLSIVSDFDAIFVVDGKNFVLNKDEQRVEIDFEEKDTLSGFVYPTKDKLLPYVIQVVRRERDFECSSPYIELYQVDNGLFEMRLKKFGLSSFNLGKVFAKDIMGYSLMVLESETSLFVVKEKDAVNTFEIESRFKELAFDVKGRVPYFVATLKGGKYLCVFCPSTQKFFAYEAISIKIDENKLEIIEDLSSHAGHGKKIVLSLEDDKVVVESEELLYLDQEPKTLSNLKVVPFAFFESIKLEDYTLAKTYLSPALKNSLSEDILKDYFGDFTKVVPYNFSSERGYFVSLFTESLCKVFSFNFESGKISDINFLREYSIKSKKEWFLLNFSPKNKL